MVACFFGLVFIVAMFGLVCVVCVRLLVVVVCFVYLAVGGFLWGWFIVCWWWLFVGSMCICLISFVGGCLEVVGFGYVWWLFCVVGFGFDAVLWLFGDCCVVLMLGCWCGCVVGIFGCFVVSWV